MTSGNNNGNQLELPMQANKSAEIPLALRASHRFGELSHNSFFTRHNPHSYIVGYLETIHGEKIRVIRDDKTPRTMVFDWSCEPSRVPVNYSVAQLNKQNILNLVQIDQQLRGQRNRSDANRDVLTNLPTRPRSADCTRKQMDKQELQNFAGTVLSALEEAEQAEAKAKSQVSQKETPETSRYSLKTGRLLETPRKLTKAGTRNTPRSRSPLACRNAPADLSEQEATVLQVLCQLLRLDSVEAAGSWLSRCGERERALTIGLVRSILHARKDSSFPSAQLASLAEENATPCWDTTTSAEKKQVDILKLDDSQNAAGSLEVEQSEDDCRESCAGKSQTECVRLPPIKLNGNASLTACPHCNYTYSSE